MTFCRFSFENADHGRPNDPDDDQELMTGIFRHATNQVHLGSDSKFDYRHFELVLPWKLDFLTMMDRRSLVRSFLILDCRFSNFNGYAVN